MLLKQDLEIITFILCLKFILIFNENNQYQDMKTALTVVMKIQNFVKNIHAHLTHILVLMEAVFIKKFFVMVLKIVLMELMKIPIFVLLLIA